MKKISLRLTPKSEKNLNKLESESKVNTSKTINLLLESVDSLDWVLLVGHLEESFLDLLAMKSKSKDKEKWAEYLTSLLNGTQVSEEKVVSQGNPYEDWIVTFDGYSEYYMTNVVEVRDPNGKKPNVLFKEGDKYYDYFVKG